MSARGYRRSDGKTGTGRLYYYYIRGGKRNDLSERNTILYSRSLTTLLPLCGCSSISLFRVIAWRANTHTHKRINKEREKRLYELFTRVPAMRTCCIRITIDINSQIVTVSAKWNFKLEISFLTVYLYGMSLDPNMLPEKVL